MIEMIVFLLVVASVFFHEKFRKKDNGEIPRIVLRLGARERLTKHQRSNVRLLNAVHKHDSKRQKSKAMIVVIVLLCVAVVLIFGAEWGLF